MLRSDTTALFERLREANILLQEVLSGAHENMSSLERTMVTRVSEFVAAMNEVGGRSDTTTTMVEKHLGTFNTVTTHVLHELGQLSMQFSEQGRSLAEAVELLDRSNRRAEDSVAGRRAMIEALVSTLDARTEDFGQRLQRFSGLLDESLDAATTRAREVAGIVAETSTESVQVMVSTLDARADDFGQRLQRFSGLLDELLDAATTRAREIAVIVAETSNESVQTIEQQYELVRATSEEERRRTNETFNAVYDDAAGQMQSMFNQSAERFTEIMQGMRRWRRRCSRSWKRPAPNCAAAFWNCRRRPPTAPRKCGASSSTRSRPWRSSIASSPAMAARSTPSSRCVLSR